MANDFLIANINDSSMTVLKGVRQARMIFESCLQALPNPDIDWFLHNQAIDLQRFPAIMHSISPCFLAGSSPVSTGRFYFTAAPVSEEKSSRQSAFLNANKILNPDLFEIVRGKYIEKEICCRLCNQVFLRPKEKKTDVNISVRMIKDCIQDKTDKLILVSADSDLIPPLEAIRELFPQKKLKVHFPPAHFSRDIKDCISRWKQKPVLLEKNERRFKDALMSDLVCEKYSIPEKWKQQMK